MQIGSSVQPRSRNIIGTALLAWYDGVGTHRGSYLFGEPCPDKSSLGEHIGGFLSTGSDTMVMGAHLEGPVDFGVGPPTKPGSYELEFRIP